MSLRDDYQTIRQGAALGAIAPRAQIAVSGADRAPYLQGLLTNDIPALQPGTGCYSAWLTPQGRMLADLHVLASAEMILLDVPAGVADATLQRLDQFLFSEDVALGSLAGVLESIWIHGPDAPAVLTRVLGADGLSSWTDYRHARFLFDDTPVVLARIDQLGVPGFCVYLEPARVPAFIGALHSSGARSVGADAIAAARVESGYPVFGTDMTEDTIPLEAGIEQRAISFTKGCYVGQEIVIRVLHRGGGRVAKKLVGLRLTRPATAGDALYAGEKAIGTITSAAESPDQGPIALGYVHRDYVASGTAIAVADASGQRQPATVR